LQALANHHALAILRSAPEVRVLPSTGVTRPQQYYDPVRIPLTPPPRATLRPLPSCQTGLPRLPEPPFQRAVPTTPADRMGADVDCFPIHTAFPVIQAGRHPHHHFRGLLRLHSRYGPLDCSTARGGLCHEASTRSVTRPSRSSATEAIDNSPGEIFLHWWFAPSGRTEYGGLTDPVAGLRRMSLGSVAESRVDEGRSNNIRRGPPSGGRSRAQSGNSSLPSAISSPAHGQSSKALLATWVGNHSSCGRAHHPGALQASLSR
jgi:hypothetical protein